MPTRPLTIVGLGDSTTAGSPYFLSPLEAPPDGRGNPEGQYTYWMTQRHPEWRVLNRGVNRERTDQVLRRAARDAIAPRPEYAIVLAGVNDVYQGREVDAARADLAAIYRAISAAGIRVVAATILPFNTMSREQAEVTEGLNRWISEEARRSGALFCDTASVASASDRRDRLAGSSDGLHPDVATYRKMGDAFARLIEASEGGAEPGEPGATP